VVASERAVDGGGFAVVAGGAQRLQVRWLVCCVGGGEVLKGDDVVYDGGCVSACAACGLSS